MITKVRMTKYVPTYMCIHYNDAYWVYKAIYVHMSNYTESYRRYVISSTSYTTNVTQHKKIGLMKFEQFES